MSIKHILFYFIFVFSLISVCGQEQRILLRGKLLYRNNNVIAANVVNNTAQLNTITNQDGEFEIFVRTNDEIIFSSVQYKIKSVIISEKNIKNNRIVVEVNERINFLDEVVVSPENQEKFLDLKEEEFKRINYLNDKSTKIQNQLINKTQLVDGINFINIAKVISNNFSDKSEVEKRNLLPSDVLPYIFENGFFTEDIGIPEEKLNDFLKYIDKLLPSQKLLSKNKEFQLIEFLIEKGYNYKKELNL